jgi:hypothetical protein
MKRIFFLLLVITVITRVQAQNDIVVDPNAEVRTVNGSYHAIKVSGGIDIFLSQADNEVIAVSASEKRFKEEIKTTVDNGTLKIYYEGDKNWSRVNRKLKVYISFKQLDKISASGASEVMVVGSITGESLGLDLSGASGFRGKVKLSDLKMDLSGASDVKISGTANTVSIESSGASDVKGYELVTDICSAKASGASDINITVNKELNAHASGASDIFFKGTALIKEIHANGTSNIERKGN